MYARKASTYTHDSVQVAAARTPNLCAAVSCRYGGAFAISGAYATVNASRLWVSLHKPGPAAHRGGVFAVLNGAQVDISDSAVQGRAEFGGVFYLGPAMATWSFRRGCTPQLERGGSRVTATRCRFHDVRAVSQRVWPCLVAGLTVPCPWLCRVSASPAGQWWMRTSDSR